MTRLISAARVAVLVGDLSQRPAYRGLAESLRVLITDGRVPIGVRLPSERELTRTLGVSRTTVTKAYAVLRDHGYLESTRGSGSVATLPASAGRRSDHLLPPGDLPAGKVDLTCAAPLPGPGIHDAYTRAAGELPAYLAGTGYYPSGLHTLRHRVARSYDGRGLPTRAEQIMIVPGALAGVSIAVRALVRHGDKVALESPTYPNAIACLRSAGARLVSTAITEDEHNVSELTATLTRVRPRVAYLVPDFQNPTGVLMSDEERARVAATLDRAGTVPIIDESMVLLALDGQEMPQPFAAYSPDAISVGSLSKPFWGGLRIGWVRAPEGRVDDLFKARLSMDLGAALLEQIVAADLLENGAALLEHRRLQLRESRDAALRALAEQLPDWRVSTPAGGLNLWCELPRAGSTALTPRAAERGVLLASGPDFAPEGGLDRFVRIPYTQPAAVLGDAITEIAAAWKVTPTGPLDGDARRGDTALVA